MAKTTRQKAVETDGGLGIKYADKSPGQPELLPVFEAIKKRLLPYATGWLKLRGGEGGQVALVSEKQVAVDGRAKKEIWFASALVQKGYVGFYFTPVCFPDVQRQMDPALLSCLKGKTCFHITRADPAMLKHIEAALKAGYDKFEQSGWI